MRKHTFSALVIAGLLISTIGVASSASALTIDEIQAQIKTLLGRIAELQLQMRATTTAQTPPADTVGASMSAKHRICSVLYRNLARGARGDDVRGLQEFLSTEGYLSASATGYFGPMTAQAVAKWQASQGVSAVGAFGPMSRERIKLWCGDGGGHVCTKEYAPICGQPSGCENTCPPGALCAMSLYCKQPQPQTYGNLCTLKAAGAGYLYDGTCRTDTGNKPPVISSFSGPTTLAVNASGTWSINASDPENGQLTYKIWWGDENIYAPMMGNAAARESFVQTTTFTHAYAAAGTYTITITVSDASGQEARTSSTVRIGDEPTYCTLQYDPVCGQPPEPACRRSTPACMMPTPGPQTYGNRCTMNAADATFLYSGQCSSTY